MSAAADSCLMEFTHGVAGGGDLGTGILELTIGWPRRRDNATARLRPPIGLKCKRSKCRQGRYHHRDALFRRVVYTQLLTSAFAAVGAFAPGASALTILDRSEGHRTPVAPALAGSARLPRQAVPR